MSMAIAGMVWPAMGALTGGDEDFEFTEDSTHIPAMIKVNEGDVNETIANLEDMGVTVLYHRGDILLTYIPIDVVPELSVGRGVKRVKKIEVEKPRFNCPSMDDARNFHQAYRIYEGIGLPQPYDGSGVVVGICDIGMDTRHPNFLTSDGKECRIRRVVHYRELQGERTVYSTPQEIYDWRTDNDDEYHATHVTGIAAGGYKGNGYHSLAPAADIVFTASQLSDVGLLAGVEDIIVYAREVGKPAVINLSMGNVLGPRDGTSLFTQYLDRCAEDAIICISAGNDGGGVEPHGLQFDFTENNRRIEVQTTDWAGLQTKGRAEIWSKDATPFKFSLYLHHNTSKSKNIYTFDRLDFTDPEVTSWRISADPEDPDFNEDFAAHYNRGVIMATGGVNPLNNRYYVSMDYDVETDETSPISGGSWALYWLGIAVDGDPGMHVDIHCGAGYTFLRGEAGFKAPGPDLSISDLATGFKTITVGMTNNKETETLIDGTERPTGYPGEGVNVNSSYGTLIDGRVLPLTCAPGSMVVSSMSGAYLEKYPEAIPYMNAVVDYDGGKAYWMSEIGTSMSTPYVAGAIATWLQAYPSLISEEAIEYIRMSNREPATEPDNPRNGQGWFDPYNGLLALLKSTVLDVESLKLQEMSAVFHDGQLFVDNLTGGEVKVKLYSLSGIPVLTQKMQEGKGSITLRDLEKGIYLIHLENRTGLRKVEKIFVR